ncbi:MAG: Phosphatidylinositol alpha-1,6-mannosyltransferase [Candidatus Uhrbacteria bacterium GW2011_GWF2_39_13]|uniref:Phosphatidylinositol alpha-1,6-mannosyltransferase n=1 Tax=Candidatus Uhrbacteria bacterium GW2011_GWF2_39_13 TaxID=1618995 RepID=A0A0G0Q390_9BACT|nr:MAG: Phosphatidylinositol alpha-1,6-mannosyltransferase [Candidatus Uhrbacteria bacterium GW2011_GWF2_39_13]
MLLITPDFPPHKGGIATYLSTLALYFKTQIEILTQTDPQAYLFDTEVEYPIHRKSLFYKWIWPHWLKIVIDLFLYRHNYRIILISHLLPVGTAAFFSKKITKVPYILFVHGMDLRLANSTWRKQQLSTRVLKEARLVVANSKALAKEITNRYGVPDVLVLYPCLSAQNNPLPHVRKDHSIFTLLTVSRLVERKGHIPVLHALADLKRSGKLPEFIYHIVGVGPTEFALKSLVSELSLEKHVVFHGSISDEERWNLYNISDVFIMPVSLDPIDKEGFGLVFIEAAQAGVPSLSTKIEGVDEAIIDGETGILLPDQNTKVLADTLFELYSNRALRQKLSDNARKHAQTFLCEVQMKKLEPYL